jgi:ABC-2 type transport system ATP-binding protein
MHPDGAAISTRGLMRSFNGRLAVCDLNLTVPRGVFYGFLGTNGAGKSTTIRMLTGLLAPTAGEMRVLGMDITNGEQAIAIKRRIGVVPEGLALFDYLTGPEYLTFVAKMHGLTDEVRLERMGNLLSLMDLTGEPEKLCIDYSHGMKKKLSLAAAMIHVPDLLFLDEPFEGVDPVSARIIRGTLQRFVANGGTVFVTSHVMEIIERLCTHVGIVSAGKLVLEETMENIRAGGTLEETFIRAAGEEARSHERLEWLEAPHHGS